MNDFFTIVSSNKIGNVFYFDVTINPNSQVFKGHFPNQPVVPGVFSIDMIRQCFASTSDFGTAGRFHSIKQCKFLQPIIPKEGQILRIEIHSPQTGNTPLQATIFENDKPVLKLKATILNVAVIIPTYNNEKTITKVVEEVKYYADNIIVVNDGSTDGTGDILRSTQGITLLQHTTNRGTGAALKTTFRHALATGFTHAITIDADGQHKASNIPAFLNELANAPASAGKCYDTSNGSNTLIIGARNLHAENMPPKNTFANKFSNFWIWAETSVRLQDTQSGFRLYPLEPLRKMKFITHHYDFEVELMVRLSWKGVILKNIPIDVYYPPADEKVSHFKPFKDFARISALNFLLVFYALLWAHPTRFFRQFSWRDFVYTKDSNIKIALSVGTGIACGILPAWGCQMILAGVTALAFKLNKLITIASSNISIPPMIPVILYASYAIGELVVGRPVTISFSHISFETIGTVLFQYITGSFILAGTAGFVFGVISYILLSIFRKRNFNK
jgi:glycosyltransferase involved in cell wall biosynthesis/3-hydroxymyristoyl/3-hydroxydecanoyl-(acyl carrier protein) dehydratase